MNWLFRNALRLVLLLGPLATFLITVGCGSVRPSSGGDSPSDNAPVANAVAGGISSKEADGTQDSGDQLRIGDPISIRFSGVLVADPPPGVDERIKSDGMIRLPLIREPVKAEGKTRGQLEEEIYKLYVPKIFKNLTVKVGSEGRTVYVGGEVRIQGRVQY